MAMDEGIDEVFEVSFQEKVTENDLNYLILRGVKLTSFKLGQGSFGTVYKAEHNGTECAAKQRDINVKSQGLLQRKKHHFLLECLQHSKLDHPNIVKMLGVFYPKLDILPVLVMELMDCNLTQLLEKSPNIIMYVKLSILQDVSRGLCYLHTQNPPIVHQALYSDNILITKGLTAKIGDFKTGTETVSDQAVLSERRIMQIYDFLPDSDNNIIKYDLALNVFSFGCIVCHVIIQSFPSIQHQPEINTDDGPAHKLRSTPAATSVSVEGNTPLIRRKSSTLDDWSVNKYQQYIDLIHDNSLKQLVEACLQCKSKYRPQMSLVYERITSIMTDHCNDDGIKRIYSQVIEQGLDQSMNFQLLLVGAENTGKTSLMSSLLGEEFIEEQPSTKGADVKVCKVYSKDWSRISDEEKSDILQRRYSDLCKDEVLKSVANFSISTSPEPSSPILRIPRRMSYPDVLFTIAPLPKSLMTPCSSGAAEYSSKPHPQNMQEAYLNIEQYNTDSLIVSFWDFAGQTIFHNSHSVFISDSGVSVITFNASMKLTDKIIPREDSSQPPECCTIISSIHYWLQVVNSVCSVKENVLLAGTHIDKLHPDLKEARKIARDKILPELEKELFGKPYAQHIACIGEGLTIALKKSCFFVSNKYRDEEIVYLKAAAVEISTSLREEKPIFFLKIEQALLQLNKKVISVSTMLDLVAANGFSFNKNSPEFKGILKYFHNNRIILHFSQIESLKDLVILSPNWLAKLFSYVIAAQSYIIGGRLDWAWKRLTKHGILHECLLQHMLNKFNSEYPDLIQVTKQQAVDILLCFHLLARITSTAWFTEEGHQLQPLERGDTFIVPSLVCTKDDRNPPETKQEKIIYFFLNSSFIPISLLNQLIAECICRSVRRNDKLLWMRRGKMGSQLGAHQKYYISRCEDKQSIQLTITVVGDDAKHIEERRDLINDIIKFLNDIMKVFMPATKKRPSLWIPCPFCSELHIFLDDACSGKDICCPNANDKSLPSGYYSNVLQGKLTDASTIAEVNRKLEVFYANYYKLIHLNFKALCPHLVNAKIISDEVSRDVLLQKDPTKAASQILEKISDSLKGGMDVVFDDFLSILENNDLFCTRLAEEIRRDLLNNANAITLPVVKQPGRQDIKSPHEKQGLCSRPPLKDLYSRVVPSVADKWKDIGVELLHPTLINNRVLEVIAAKHPHSIEECCKSMFEKWLESQKDASWNQLIEAIKTTGLDYFASKLENEPTECYQHKSSQEVENKSSCSLM